MQFTLIAPIVLFLVGLIHLFETFYLEKNKEKGKTYAKWTLPALSMGFVLVLASSLSEFYSVNRTIDSIISGMGLLITLIRIPIKLWAAKTLGQYWSPHVKIRSNHMVIKSGPYKYLRHPVYFAASMELVGIPLFVNAYYTLVSTSLVLVSLIVARMYIEEKVLLAELGEQYIEYKKETWGMIPLIH
ncbi:MAG: isoprenylcysteine carboxylmethyltransferase family protein [Elusimicrobia bacterium]|nr:isoprenylcysteine carboxylmethyltransferase family protein [Candidatus Liberimonas magnetica]